MNKTTILIAGGVGIIIGLGFLGFKRFLKLKSKEYDDYYEDFHRHFGGPDPDEYSHGVEFLAVK